MFNKVNVSPLSAANYRDPLPNVDNNILDVLILMEFKEIRGHTSYGIEWMRVNQEACKALIDSASDLSYSLEQSGYSISTDIEYRRAQFEKNLVITYNSLPIINIDNINCWQDLKSAEEKLKFVIGFILDSCYKNTEVSGQYTQALTKLGMASVPRIIHNLQFILFDPRKAIAKFTYKIRYNQFQQLLTNYIFNLSRDSQRDSQFDADSFQKFLKEYSDIDFLTISCPIKDSGLMLLLNNLKDNRTIKTLDLSKNNLTSQGMETLAEWLKNNTTIKKLIVSGNPINDKGLTYLLNSLRHNKTLKHLNISSCDISKQGNNAIADFLGENPDIISIEMGEDSSSISELELNALLTSFKTNNTLGSLIICSKKNSSQSNEEIEENAIKNELIEQINIATERNRATQLEKLKSKLSKKSGFIQEAAAEVLTSAKPSLPKDIGKYIGLFLNGNDGYALTLVKKSSNNAAQKVFEENKSAKANQNPKKNKLY